MSSPSPAPGSTAWWESISYGRDRRRKATPTLDDGERDLLSVALTLRADAWWLCGPDKATIYAMHLLGILDRMCSLQSLAEATGIKLSKLEDQFTEKWLATLRTQLVLTTQLI